MIHFDELLEHQDRQALRDALSCLLHAHASPVFGAAKQIEHEVAAIKALQRLNAISAEPDEYELVMALRVTKAKARALLYQVALRKENSPGDIDAALRSLLSTPKVWKDGDMVLVEVPQPFLMDNLRHRIRKLGFMTDGSFSGSVARVPLPAIAALVTDLIPRERQKEIEKSLRRQGISGSDLPSLIIGVLQVFGKKVAGAAGKQVAEQIGEKLGDLLIEKGDVAFAWIKDAIRSKGAT